MKYNLRLFYDNMEDSIKEYLSDDDYDGYYEKMVNKNMNEELDDKDICDNCYSSRLVNDSMKNIVFCGDCGCHVKNMIIFDQQYGDGDDGRNGNSGSILVSYIMPDISMLSANNNASKNIRKLIMWDAIKYKEKKTKQDYDKMQKVCLDNNINKNIENTAKIIYNELFINNLKIDKKNKVYKGKNYLTLFGMCLQKACLINNHLITKKEIATMLDIDKKEMKRGVKLFNNEYKNTNLKLKQVIFSTIDYLEKYFKLLNLNPYYYPKCVQITSNLEKIKIVSEHNSESVAIAVLYYIIETNKIPISKKAISEKFDISHVTVSKLWKKITPFSQVLSDDDICNMLGEAIYNHQMNVNNSLLYIDNCFKFNKKINIDVDENNVKIIMMMQYYDIIKKTMMTKTIYLKTLLNNNLRKYKILCYKS